MVFKRTKNLSDYSLNVIFEDDYLIGINKAANMLAVHGNTVKRMPRQMEWIDAIKYACNDNSNNILDKNILNYIKKLSNNKSVPRKEKQFKSFVKRTLKIDNEDELVDKLYDYLINIDDFLHRPLIKDLPKGWISVLEYAQDCCNHKIYAVHRLDQATSGVFLMAKTQEAAAKMSKLFQTRNIKKKYKAEIYGHIDDNLLYKDNNHNVDNNNIYKVIAKLRADENNKPKQIVDDENGKESETIVKVLKKYYNNTSTTTETTLVELQPLTGRTHQLRVHMASLGTPIVGDGLYAPEIISSTGKFKVEVVNKGGFQFIKNQPRLALHAHTLEFIHPFTNEEVIITAPLDSFKDDQNYVDWPDEQVRLEGLNKTKIEKNDSDTNKKMRLE